MRISKERQDARIRVAEIQVAIEEALDNLPDTHKRISEITLALTEKIRVLQDELLRKENPNPDKEVEDD